MNATFTCLRCGAELDGPAGVEQHKCARVVAEVGMPLSAAHEPGRAAAGRRTILIDTPIATEAVRRRKRSQRWPGCKSDLMPS